MEVWRTAPHYRPERGTAIWILILPICASGVGMTVGPTGGSKQPTSTPVALLGVPA